MQLEETIETLAHTPGAPDAKAALPVQDEIAEGQEPEAESEASTDEQEEREQRQQPPKGVQKRFSELTREKREMKAQLDQAMEIIHRLTAGQQQAQPPQQRQQQAPAARPDPKQFVTESGEVDPLAYLEALAGHIAEQRLNPVMEAVQRMTQAQAMTAQQSAMAEVTQREAAYAAQHADYQQALAVAQSHPLFETPFALEVARDPDGPAIAHYLGTHPEEMDALARMPPAGQLRALGRIGYLATSQSGQKPAAQVSKAPPPIKPVSAGGKTDNGYLGRQDISYRAWEALRNAELKRAG